MSKIFMFFIISIALLTGCQSSTTSEPKQISGSSVSPAVTPEPTHTTILIYSVANLSGPLTSIPYYSKGEVVNLPEETFKQFKEGHQPTLGDSFTAAVIKTTNLTTQDIENEANPNNAKNTNTLTLKQGVVIKRTDKNMFIDGDERKASYEITVPSIGKYNITVEKPSNTDIFFITKITLTIH
ncbi:hypothetical protein ACFQZT_15115 [Paenibacillus sp. GCM10027628]|uniref:hypothetical protein n=1 Tax=Paenibacillus sp. GCM10027628 TaxID=3273413 RepID=UPI0036332C78